FDRLAKGDDRVCALAEYAGYTLYQEKGADIDFVAPPEGLPAIAIYVGVVNKAPHPEAAKLFMDWALSRRGQAIYQNQKILLYGSVRNDAGPMPTGKRLSDFKLLFPTDLGRYAHLFGNTLLVAVVATVLAIVLGFGMAWILSRTNVPGREAFEQLMAMPYYVTPLMGALAWALIASPNSGFVNQAWRA